MALNYKSLQASSTAAQTLTLYTCGVTTTLVKSVLVHNSGANATDIVIKLQKSGGGTQVVLYQYKGVLPDGNQQLANETVVMENGDTLYASLSGADMHITVNFVESTAALSVTSVRELSDWSADTPANGEVPIYNSTTGEYEPGTVVSGATDLDGLTDVSATTPTDGDVIVYQSGASGWITSGTLEALRVRFKTPTTDTTVVGDDPDTKITVDKTTGAEQIVARVGATDALVVKDTHVEIEGVIVQNQGRLTLRETTANGTNAIVLRAPASVTSTTTFTLPDGDGSAGQFLKTDGSANLSWATPAGGGTGAVDSVNGQTGVVVLYGTDIEASSTDPTTITALVTPAVDWEAFWGQYYSNSGTGAFAFLYFGGSEVKLTIRYPDNTASNTGGAVLQAGSSFLEVRRNLGVKTDKFSFPNASPVPYGGDAIIQAPFSNTTGAYSTIWGAPWEKAWVYKWTTGYFNLTNNTDNAIPFDTVVQTLGVSYPASPTPPTVPATTFTIQETGLYHVDLRVHLYDQTGGMDLTAGIVKGGVYTEKLIDVGPTSSGTSDRIYQGTTLIQFTTGDLIQFVINPSANSPYPSNSGAAVTQVILTWKGGV